MACEAAVVAAAAGGILEIVQDGENGLLYPPGSSEAMAAQVLRVLENPELRRHLVSGGLHTFETKFSLESHLNQMMSQFQSLR